MNTARTAFVAAAIGLLSACGSPPSDADLQQALTQQFVQLSGEVDQGTKDMIKTTRLLSCIQAGDSKAYQCDVIGPFGLAQSMRLVKSDRGWMIVQ